VVPTVDDGPFGPGVAASVCRRLDMPEASDKPGESAAAGQSVPRPDSNGEDRTGQRDNAERLRAIVDTAVDGSGTRRERLSGRTSAC
jgi:hypothetical protein